MLPAQSYCLSKKAYENCNVLGMCCSLSDALLVDWAVKQIWKTYRALNNAACKPASIRVCLKSAFATKIVQMGAFCNVLTV